MPSTTFNPPVPTLEAVTGIGDTTVPDGDGIIVPGENDYSSSRNKRTLRSYISSLTKGIEPTPDSVPGLVEGTYSGPTPIPHANPFPLEPSDSGIERKFTDQEGLRAAIDRDTEPSPIFGDTNSIVNIGSLGEANDTLEMSGHELLPGVVGSSVADGDISVKSEGARAYATTLGQALSSKNLNSGKLTVASDAGQVGFEDKSFLNSDVPTTSRVLLGDTLVDGVKSRSYSTQDVKYSSEQDLHKIAVTLMESAVGGVDGKLGKRTISSNITRAASIGSFSGLNRTTLSSGRNDFESNEERKDTDGVYTQRVWPTLYSPDETYTGFESANDAFSAFVISGTFLAAVFSTAALGLFIPAIAKGMTPAEVNTGGIYSSRKLKSGKFSYVEETAFWAGLSAVTEVASNVTGLNVPFPIYSPTNSLTDYPGCVIAGLASFLGVTYKIDPDLIFLNGFLNTNTPIITAQIAVRILAIFVDPASRQYYMNIIRELNRDTIALGGELNNASYDGGFISDVGSALGTLSSIFDSKLFKFVNTLAQIGDLAYTQTAAIDYRRTDMELNPGDVYKTFDPGTDKSSGQKILMRGYGARRIYGNKLEGRRGTSYALSDLPSYHLVPTGSNQSYQKLLNYDPIASRIKSVKATSFDGRYRFTPEQVSQVESVLEAEYMPFYFQDLRTNEIVSFHAFLDDLSDSYTANYNSAGGYGRIEEVKTYKDTKRSVGFSFHIVATNPDDFDYMWWQINKLTSIVYPQWSKGRDLTAKVNFADFKFSQPFSQIPTATPVVRVRIGDLIRSNYSRFNLKRLFGYQDNEKNQSAATSVPVVYFLPPGKYELADQSGIVDIKEEIILGESLPKKETQSKIEYLVYSIEANAEIRALKSRVSPRAWNSDEGQNAQSFYNPENNAIIKSFETARGLGLAGVVTQLQFTWMDASILWGAGEDGPGNRAPRACKVQVSFEPIHDIAPGLDYEGFNRAPIYPVGKLVNSIVEGGEQEPYGVGTVQRSTEASDVAADKSKYEDSNKQTTLQKLF